MEQQTLRDLLDERSIKMDAAAVLAGVSPSTISRICSGSEKARPKTIASLAKALGISARRMKALCDASHEAAHSAALPVDGQWTVWAWNGQIGLWVRVDEGLEEDVKKSLNHLLQSAAGTYAISKSGASLPALPVPHPVHGTDVVAP